MSELIYPDETYAIRGAIYEVHNVMGSGFLEAVYQECLAKEFGRRRIPFQAQAELRLMYKDEPLVQVYKADFICFERIIVELKAVKEPAPEHKAQVLNYLKSTGLRLGLLANFGSHPKVDIERIIL